MRPGVQFTVVAAAALLVGLLAYGVASQRQDTSIDEAILKGERIAAPQAVLPRLGRDGSASVADFKGQVVVLNFWASWCGPCKEELPLLERTQKRIAPERATVLGVNYKDLTDSALEAVEKYGVSFPSVRDRDGEYAEKYASRAFPETFVIDRKGRIAARRRGPVDQEWLDETLPPLLAEQA